MGIPLVGLLVATFGPLVFYGIAYRLFWRGKLGRLPLAGSFAWGVVAFGLSLAISKLIFGFGLLSQSMWVQLVAPVIETILILPILFLLSARHQIRGYVDATAYGAAALIAFAIVENIVYVTDYGASVAIGRVLTTNNVHGVAGALLGLGSGMVRYQKKTLGKVAWVVGTLVLAAAWKVSFNNLVTRVESPVLLLYALVYAAGGLALISAATSGARLQDSNQQTTAANERTNTLLHRVIPLGVALSSERDFVRLLESILTEAMAFCNADGGELYLRTSQDHLQSVVACTPRTGISHSRDQDSVESSSKLFDDHGAPANRRVSTLTIIRGMSINGPDPAQMGEYEITPGVVSLLCVPLKDSSDNAIGALELTNARHPMTNDPIRFSFATQEIVESVSTLASAALVSHIRESALRKEVRSLKIKVDDIRTQDQVQEITDSEFFSELRARLQEMRHRKATMSIGSSG